MKILVHGKNFQNQILIARDDDYHLKLHICRIDDQTELMCNQDHYKVDHRQKLNSIQNWQMCINPFESYVMNKSHELQDFDQFFISVKKNKSSFGQYGTNCYLCF